MKLQRYFLILHLYIVNFSSVKLLNKVSSRKDSFKIKMAHIIHSVSGSQIDLYPIKRALLSVSDKTGLIDLASSLTKHNVHLLSTGGTAKALRDAGFTVTDVSDYTSSPEILDGRVKTLHPKVHGALLGVRGNEKHEKEMLENHIEKIDLVVMNLYAFEATVASGAAYETCIENIDIGGPSMLRSASKNHAYVSVLTNPSQYSKFVEELNSTKGSISLATRKSLAGAAFALSASYDASISQYFATQLSADNSVNSTPVVGQMVTRSYECFNPLKYGCNPHQKPAAIYRTVQLGLPAKTPFTIINGTPGYINLLDACNAWQLVYELKQALNLPAAASFKHCSPAGAAVAVPLTPVEAAAYEITDLSSLSPTALAYVRARNADPMCSFGDFAAVSHIVDVSTANVFKTEVCDGIIAPGFEPAALEILKAKKKGAFIVLQANEDFICPSMEYREVYGLGFSQKRNDVIFTSNHLKKIVTHSATEGFSTDAERDLILASVCVKYTQSNSVGYAKNGQMVGVGAGQQSRVDCVKLAGRKVSTWFLRQHPKVQNLPFKAGVKRQDRVNARVRYIEGDITTSERVEWLKHFDREPEPLSTEEKNTFLATLSDVAISSDAFFPFRDSIDHASKVGVKYIAQPGGSVADDEVINACKEYHMKMAFTDLRLFHH